MVVTAVVSEARERPVYNLAVAEANEFVAGGILVHNCDSLSLGASFLAKRYKKPGVASVVIGREKPWVPPEEKRILAPDATHVLDLLAGEQIPAEESGNPEPAG